MRVVRVDVMLAEQLYQQINGKIVTIPEVSILTHLHGKNAVLNVQPLPKDWQPENEREKRMVKGDQNEERERLRAEYGINRKTGVLVADEVFPGAIAKLPDTLAEIGMDPSTLAANMREKAKQLMAAAERMETSEDPDADTKPSAKTKAA